MRKNQNLAAASQAIWSFEPFRVDAANARLSRDGEAIHLAPRVFALLCCLLERAGRLVSKDEIFDAVWTHRYVSESALKARINELRQALGDHPKTPRFIETVTGRGYRFIAEVNRADGARPPVATIDPPAAAALAPIRRETPDALPRVGREDPLARLQELWNQAVAGRRQLAFVTGEAGIGKSTLIEMFLDRIGEGPLGVLWGRCVEHLGVGEAFLPLIEALEKRCRRPGAEGLIARLRRYAPTWLAQLPGSLDAAAREALQREILGATQARMLREFCEFAETLSREIPLLLVLEDLHWSDAATLDLLALLLRRHEPAALLVVGSYRPEDAHRNGHGVESIRREAQVHDRCVDIALDTLTLNEVADYLRRRFAHQAVADGVAEALHRRSGGHPLSMVKLLDYFVGRGGFNADAWCVPSSGEVLTAEVPQDLRQLIGHQFERLAPAEQRLLEAASVAGAEWSAALVAAILGESVVDTEAAGDALAREQRWLHLAGIEEWPDGTVAGRFAFGHALYEEVLCQRVTPARKILWHRRVGECLERGWGTRVEEVAAVLALHFERARDYPRAVGYLRLAAKNSARRFASQEALHYLEHALELLGTQPCETRLDILQQNAAVRRGMGDMRGAVEVLETMREWARTLGHGSGEIRALIDLSRAYLWIDRRRTLELAEEAVACSERLDDPITRILAVATRAGWGFYLEGWQDSYAEICREALAAARRLNDPVILNTRLSWHTMLETYASNYRLADAAAEEGMRLAESLGDGYLFYLIRYFDFWSLLHLGDWGKASRLVHEGLQAAKRNENVLIVRNCMILIALLHCEALDFEGALALCEKAAPLLVQRPDVISASLFGIVSAKAHLGLGNTGKALDCLNAELSQAADRVMDWFFYFPLHFTFGEFWLAQGDRVLARHHGERLRELAARPPERTYLALSHGLLARIAMAEGTLEEAGTHLSEALSITEKAEIPLAAWRVQATAAEFAAFQGQGAEAERHRSLGAEVFRRLANSVGETEGLRPVVMAHPLFG